MERLATSPAVAPGWSERRQRAAQLESRWSFAGEMLRLYGRLLDTQERAFLATRADRPAPVGLARFIVERVMPDVVEDTVAAGPRPLAEAALARRLAGGLEDAVDRWLGGESQSPVEEYLARAASAPVLEALGAAAAGACRGASEPGGCPRCGGRPQLSYFAESAELLVTTPRRLSCCRCGDDWIHERMTCPACGERSTDKLSIHADAERLPHLRADACESCRRYLITVDLRVEPEGVPVVDELGALPLDLYMQERGFAKIVPNLMGI
jgi:FdhE protein